LAERQAGLKTGDAEAGLVEGQGQPSGKGHAEADSGKAARPGDDRDPINILEAYPRTGPDRSRQHRQCHILAALCGVLTSGDYF
jgi:hypothetical protein